MKRLLLLFALLTLIPAPTYALPTICTFILPALEPSFGQSLRHISNASVTLADWYETTLADDLANMSGADRNATLEWVTSFGNLSTFFGEAMNEVGNAPTATTIIGLVELWQTSGKDSWTVEQDSFMRITAPPYMAWRAFHEFEIGLTYFDAVIPMLLNYVLYCA